jgi:glycoprotein endo-alpha-1,2-mannosidase
LPVRVDGSVSIGPGEREAGHVRTVSGPVLRAILLGLLPVALAAGCWRLERDRPAWLLTDWGQTTSHAAASLPAQPRLVLAFHYPWYGTPGGPAGRWWHWNHARLEMPAERVLGFHDPRRIAGPGRLDIGASHYPEGGPYDSRDPARIRAQMLLARAAGLDGFVVSWWGRESEEARGLAALFAHAGEAGLLLAPYYETGELRRRGALGVAADLESLLDRHGGEPAWLRVAGVPVVFLYASHRLRPVAWDAVLARLAAGSRRLFLVADVPSPEWLAARPGWLRRFDAVHVYTPVGFLARGRDLAIEYRSLATLASAAGRSFIPAVAPGFDDRQVRVPGTFVDRAGGATYDQGWQAAVSVQPPWILVSTWNEWHEGSEIEPSLEHGRRYLDVTRVWVERFRQGGS